MPKESEKAMPRVDVKAAVGIATNYLSDLYGSKKLPHLMLEEIELSDDDKYWLVTLGFDRPTRPDEDFRNILVGQEYTRTYKVVRVNVQTGRVQSMKMRQI